MDDRAFYVVLTVNAVPVWRRLWNDKTGRFLAACHVNERQNTGQEAVGKDFTQINVKGSITLAEHLHNDKVLLSNICLFG